jgi:hypothetical protein
MRLFFFVSFMLFVVDYFFLCGLHVNSNSTSTHFRLFCGAL